MQKLNFPEYSFRFKNSENKVSVFDEIRKKFVVLTPEEWVRQHVVQFLIVSKKYPKSYINVEKSIQINGLTKRYDVVVFYPNGKIFLVMAVVCIVLIGLFLYVNSIDKKIKQLEKSDYEIIIGRKTINHRAVEESIKNSIEWQKVNEMIVDLLSDNNLSLTANPCSLIIVI